MRGREPAITSPEETAQMAVRARNSFRGVKVVLVVVMVW